MNILYVNENCLLSEGLTLIQLKFLLIPICGVAARGQVADAVVWFTNEKKFCTFLLQFKGTRQHFSGCIASLQAHIFCRLFDILFQEFIPIRIQQTYYLLEV